MLGDKRRRSIERNSRKRKERSRERNDNREPGKKVEREPERKKRRSRSRSRDRRRRDRSRSSQNNVRQRKPYRFWDVPPAGFENTSVEAYKTLLSTGKLPDIAEMNGPDVLHTTQPFAGNNNSRQSRRLYVGNLPFGMVDLVMKKFFNDQMKTYFQSEGDPVIACQINTDKNFAFLEFRSIDECSAAMALDGVECQSQRLKIKRPRDYQAPNGSSDADPADNPDKLYIGNIPVQISADNVQELLACFGKLKSFNLVMEPGSSGLSKGYAFCEYHDSNQTDNAILMIRSMEIGGRQLQCNRASERRNGVMTTALQIPGVDTTALTLTITDASQVLCLINMVTMEQLENDEEYDDIIEDIREECSKYGNVVSLEIPRPIEGVNVAGLEKVYVEFSSVEEGRVAQIALSGRRFGGNVVVSSFIDLDSYQKRDF